ncbi:ribosomal protein S18-alanine N-acetyltransferase [Stenoxybacter acetivorans]|uniref:ribosomal protein S18-alanine N-acetyltransferase n=1 Tax=Stenoxybacter acetivorans TaxID=422441 RepID=UPI00056B62D5|nr:ribosomal protein S18-alanine N-acetyltransferase [Stenoxybacter acetivorans]
MIRLADVRDIDALAQLEQICNPSAWSAAQLQAALVLPNHIWVIEAENHLAAMLVWQHMGDEAEIHLINTHPQHRRCGLARQLLNHLFQAAADMKINRVLLEVRRSNSAAQTLYHQLGFTVCGQRRAYYANGEDAVIMERIC